MNAVWKTHSRGTVGAAGKLVIALAVALAAPVGFAKQERKGKHAERDGIGMLPLSEIAKLSGKKKNRPDKTDPVAAGTSSAKLSTASATAALATPVTIDPRRSLIITEAAILQAFPILNVLNRLAAGSPQSMIARQLYDQWMDLHNAAPGIGQGGHCNDELTNGLPTLNGFAYDCPRAEGRLVGTNPTNGSADSFRPIAIVNRFDLATDPRQGGTDCGEYRIIYAKHSGETNATNRMQIIFEAVLPNPAPNGVDLSGCRPVAEFLAELSTINDPIERINRLKTFYFTGLPGFAPVVKAAHYGFATPAAPGQIRTNLFMQFNWVLRDYRLALVNNLLKVVSLPTHMSPAGLLFNETDPHPKGTDFRQKFLDVVGTLAVNDINTFHMNGLPNRFDAGDGDQQDALRGNYPAQFANSPNFSAAVQQRLTAAGSTLTPAQVVQRAMAMSCAGCHQLSNNKNLGGGLVWPASMGFVHVSEKFTDRETSPEGQSRFKISPALTNVFLPHRKAVLEAFLNGS
ncbi:MAG: hypothetical protein AB1430_07385 [Pseudomonadota bacterium]